MFGEERRPPSQAQVKPLPPKRNDIEESKPIAGTLAERYLVGRGLAAALDALHPDALRFHPRVRIARAEHPALIAVVTDSHGGKPVACQRILLAKDGGKAALDNPKLSLGTVSAGSVHLGRDRHPIVLLSEGVENALAARVGIGEGCPVATLGTPMLAKWKPPKWCKGVHLVADGDAAGYKAASKFQSRMNNAGFEARVYWLPEGDANDLLRRTP